MEIKPLITEKSLSRSKTGKYSFLVPESFTAGKAKLAIESAFSVKVGKTWVINHPGESYLSRQRKRMEKASTKIIIVSLKEGKIDIFESKPEKSEEKEKEKVRKTKKEAVSHG